ncbi:MAG: AbrB/MazE/SpoVT family DNA-binding domain-containing protein [Candidatus Freyarchaeota archaeon]
MRSTVKVTRRGQTTIPKRFREKLGIKEGDKLVVEVPKKVYSLELFPGSRKWLANTRSLARWRK